jgi:hypothetical protein
VGSATSRILDFYSGSGTDDRGRSLQTILAWSEIELEHVHNYIQWLFPLPEISGANPSAPRLDPDTMATFRGSVWLQNRLRDSFRRMLAFYGLTLRSTNAGVSIEEATNFRERAMEWLQAGNHNHLRITRMLRCLMLLGLEDEARAFYSWLGTIYAGEQAKAWPAISPGTFRYWTWAVQAPPQG